MTYEYSAASQRFEITNPYRIENIALILCGALAGIAGFMLALASRNAIGAGHRELGQTTGIVVGFLLIGGGLATIAAALKQLRFFFGRGRPRSLAPDLGQASEGSTSDANLLKENLRQNALAYREPSGAISGLVHSVFKTLIFAPEPVRSAAEAQCLNLLMTLAILIGLLVAFTFYPQPTLRAWIATAYLIVLLPRLLRPFGKGTDRPQPVSAGILSVLLIIAVPLFAPLVYMQLPNITGLEISRTLLVTLVMLAIAQTAFFAALLNQLRPRPPVNMACEQRTLSMNANPAKLTEELERQLQARWTETVPNRRYANKKVPELLSGHSGSFDGETLEETQPVPVNTRATGSIGEQLAVPGNPAILVLTLLSVLSYVGAVWASSRFAKLQLSDHGIWAAGFLAVVLALVAIYCVRSAHLLWGRVDFQSMLLWVEVRGSFEEAQVNIGNQLTAAMSTTKKIVNVESMTLRIWAAELDTVIFNKNGARHLTGMRGRPDIAKYYADHLSQFAADATVVVAPQSMRDRERIGAVAAVAQQIGATVGAGAPQLQSPAAFAPAPPQIKAAKKCHNPSCGREMPAESVFCSACGTPL